MLNKVFNDEYDFFRNLRLSIFWIKIITFISFDGQVCYFSPYNVRLIDNKNEPFLDNGT